MPAHTILSQSLLIGQMKTHHAPLIGAGDILITHTTTKGKTSMNHLFSSRLAYLPKRSPHVILTIVLLAVVMTVVTVFGAASAHTDTTTVHAATVNYLIFVYPNAPAGNHTCIRGSQGSINAPESATNNCSWRVWLYQNTQKIGRALCLRPRSATGILHTRWVYFWISSNTSTC